MPITAIETDGDIGRMLQRVENSSEEQLRRWVLGLTAKQLLGQARVANGGRVHIRPRGC